MLMISQSCESGVWVPLSGSYKAIIKVLARLHSHLEAGLGKKLPPCSFMWYQNSFPFSCGLERPGFLLTVSWRSLSSQGPPAVRATRPRPQAVHSLAVCFSKAQPAKVDSYIMKCHQWSDISSPLLYSIGQSQVTGPAHIQGEGLVQR